MTSKTKIVPRGPWILVKPDAAEAKGTEHGFIVPSNVEKEQKARGRVIDVGGDVHGVEEGDVVVYGAYAGEELKVREGAKEAEYRLLHDDDVIAFLR